MRDFIFRGKYDLVRKEQMNLEQDIDTPTQLPLDTHAKQSEQIMAAITCFFLATFVLAIFIIVRWIQVRFSLNVRLNEIIRGENEIKKQI